MGIKSGKQRGCSLRSFYDEVPRRDAAGHFRGVLRAVR